MIIIQDSELLQLNHERQTPTQLNHFDQHFIFDLSSTSCFLLSVSLSVIAIVIWAR
ncbi:MAG: hypothetical protein HRT54_17775 [Colwellia sp.]|nr:hypothetical protein [Colwellia sp.]